MSPLLVIPASLRELLLTVSILQDSFKTSIILGKIHLNLAQHLKFRNYFSFYQEREHIF